MVSGRLASSTLLRFVNLRGNDLPRATQPGAEPKSPEANAHFSAFWTLLMKLEVPLAEETDVDDDRFWREEGRSRGTDLGREAGCPMSGPESERE